MSRVPATEDYIADPVTPGEVDAVEFTQVHQWFTGRHGYEEHEVDDFLDRVADTIAAQTREIQALGARLEKVLNDTSRLAMARTALVRTGYFTADEVGPDVAPRITELYSALTP